MSQSSRWRITMAVTVAALGLAATPALHTSASSGSSLSAAALGAGVVRPYGYNHTDNNPIPGKMYFHGGPTMRTGSTNYLIFWQPTGSYMSPTYHSLIQRYFTDVGGSAFYGLMTQYYDRGGNIQNNSNLGGTWTDTSAYPSSTLSDQNIESEIAKAMTANGWTGGINHEFFVYYSRGENACSNHVGGCAFSVWCAFHWSAKINGQWVLYANMPYVGTNLSACGNQTANHGPNNDPDADSEISVSSHEEFETVTDAFGAFSSYTAWRDFQGYEIGDKCAYYYGSVAGDGGNLSIGSDRYLVQQEWSNSANYCALS